MKRKVLFCLVACQFAQAFNAQAIEGGNGHYVSGQYADFSGMPPTQPGFYFGNYFLDYANGTIGASKELPFGGIFAAGVTANLTADVPLAIYAYPFNLPDGSWLPQLHSVYTTKGNYWWVKLTLAF